MQTHHQIVSLWDMLRVNAEDFYKAMSALQHIRGIILASPDGASLPEFRPKTAKDLAGMLEKLEQPLTQMQAKLSVLALRRLLAQTAGDKPVSKRGFSAGIADIDNRLRDELSLTNLYVLDAKQAEYFDPPEPHFGALVAEKFRSAKYDIEEAGKCLGLARSTACVFHCMRVLELALLALLLNLGQAKPTNRNWGGYLKLLRDARMARGEKWVEKEFHQEIYARLDAIKDAWRNTTMHVDEVYTESAAESIFRNTQDLMVKLASRMDEQGLPLAS